MLIPKAVVELSALESLIANVETFIHQAPEFPGDTELARTIGTAVGKMDAAIARARARRARTWPTVIEIAHRIHGE